MSGDSETFLERYFRVYSKPIALTILFFTVVASIYFMVQSRLDILFPAFLPSPRKPPGRIEIVEPRFSSLGAFIISVLQGDFGTSLYPGRPVWDELLLRLPYTLTLIGVSIAISILIGFLLSAIALVWKPTKRKLTVFPHSVKAFFFGLAPLVGIVLIYVFSIKLGWFPEAGAYPREWTLSPPESWWVALTGRLRHLVLPAITLTSLFMFKNAWVMWSSGSFASNSLRKRFLTPLTTMDFPFIISAVILVEMVYTYPGIGSLIWFSLNIRDYVALIGAFITLLAITIILGYLSTVLDLTHHLSGLHKEFEERAETEKVDEKILRNQPRRNGKGHVLTRKGFITGLVIVTFFFMMAALAAHLTPYDALGLEPDRRLALSGRYAPPAWLRNYSPKLGGIPDLSENMFVNATSDWNFSSAGEGVTINESSIGDPETDGTGSLAIRFRREEYEEPYGEVRAYLTKEFNFPYAGPPSRFIGDIVLLANGTTYKVEEPFYNSTSKKTEYRLVSYLHAPIEVHVFVGHAGGETWNIYPYCKLGRYYPPKDFFVDRETGEVSIRKPSRGWIYPRYGESPISLMSSGYPALAGPEGVFEGKDPVEVIFTETPGKYVWSVEIIFKDIEYPEETVETTLYIDNFNLQLQGSSFGLLGTDNYGRDIYSQLLYSAQTIITTALPIAFLATILGFPIGFVAGRFRGWTDNLITTIVDTIFYIPVVPFLLIVAYIYGVHIHGVSAGPYLLWLDPFKMALLLTLSPLTAKAFRDKYLRKSLPRETHSGGFLNTVKDFLANFCLITASVVLLFSIIDYVGMCDPWAMSWGRMLYNVQYAYTFSNWWWFLPPIACIILFSFGFFLLGSALDERLD